MPKALTPKAPLTSEQHTAIIEKYKQGLSAGDIARDLKVGGQQVQGYIRSMINFGHLQPQGTPVAPPSLLPPETPMPDAIPSAPDLGTPVAPVAPVVTPVAAVPVPIPVVSTPAPPPVPRVAAPAPTRPQAQVAAASMSGDGFNWRQQGAQSGGWAAVGQAVRIQVERKVPNDGIVGQHVGTFTEMDLCQIYGSGIYKLVRYEPGKFPLETEVKVADNWGAPKYPRQNSGGDGRPGMNRPWGGGAGYRSEEGGRESVEFDPLARFRRSEPAPVHDTAASVTTEAIRALSQANERAVAQAEKARETGPTNVIADYLKEQSTLQERRYDQERERLSNDRKDEEARAERRAKEREEEHRRDMERIRAEGEARVKQLAEERRMIMDLEEKRISVIREEHKIRSDAMAEELRLSREASKELAARVQADMKDLKDTTASEIASAKEKLDEDMERQQKQIDKEYEIKSKSFEREHELQEKILEIRQEQLQQQTGNEVFNTINTLVKELSKGIEKVVELKKTQALAPEAQVAMVASASEGNVHAEEAADPGKKPAAQAGTEMGKAKPQEESGGALNMEKLIQDNMGDPFFKEILKEWSAHVEAEADPTTFASMFLEWMMDPVRHDVRQACSMFANVMKIRDWKKMMKILGPKLDPEVKVQFEKPFAADFYDGFKAMVLEHVRAYWQNFLSQQNGQGQQQPAAAPAPAPAAPHGNGNGNGKKPQVGPVPTQSKPEAEEEAPPAEEPQGIPVPTRAELKRVN